MAHPPLEPEDVRERLRFAAVRRDDLLALNDGDFLGADADERQQLVQEFFFHLVGAIEVLAQLVNDARGLGLSVDDTSIPRGEGTPSRRAIRCVNRCSASTSTHVGSLFPPIPTATMG